ncbi:MAG: hypothetical protein VX837_02245 [Candidatus Thermoplasmatota archaeon]|nr:hypothetical protein [Candidatus Thermoplasmatota archaeon]
MARRREPALPVLAQELSRARETHVEDREYSPTYLISEMGAKISRVLIGGVLTDIENRGSEDDPFYMARMIDPNGDTYYLRAGQYNPEGAAALSRIEAPRHVIAVGRVRSYSPDDSDAVYVSVQPENLREVSEQEVSVWAIKACNSLMRRLKGAQALSDASDPKLGMREREGLALAQEKYETVSTESYAGLLYDCLKYLSGETPATALTEKPPFTGEFETAEAMETPPATPTETVADAPPEVATAAEESSDEDQTSDADAEAAILDLVTKLDDQGEGVLYDKLRDNAVATGIDTARLDELLDSLNDQGLTYQPAFNRFRVA